MVHFGRLHYDPGSAAHILRHGVRVDEVQEVVANVVLVGRGHHGRTVLIGPTSSGRMLAVVLDPRANDVYALVTARPASRKERLRYAGSLRSGDAMTISRTKHAKLPVPEFATREEEAAFWDTHDLTDYFSFDQPVQFEVNLEPSRPVTLRIDPETFDVVQAIAREERVPLEGLLVLWIIERRDAERARRGLT